MRSDSPITGQNQGPQAVTPESDSLCATGIGVGNILTGAVIGLVRDQFSRPDNILNPDLRSLMWNPVVKTSKILIESVAKWDPKAVEMRPAVMVKRNARSVRSIAIGDKVQADWSPENGGGSVYPVDRGSRYAVIVSGSYTLFCIARSGAEVEGLAAEVQLRLLEFGPLIKQELGLLSWKVMDMGPMGILEESEQHFAIAVPVAYAFQHAWRLIPNAPVLKSVSLDVS